MLTGHYLLTSPKHTCLIVSRRFDNGVLRKRDRQSISSTAPPKRGGPQGPPPSTFLFLPIQLSNSKEPTQAGHKDQKETERHRPDEYIGITNFALKTKKRPRSLRSATPSSMCGLYEVSSGLSIQNKKNFKKMSPNDNNSFLSIL